MTKKPFISIIIPAYNMGKYLKKLLKSIYSSDFRNFEVIIVDDKSSDDTKKICKKFPISYYYLLRNQGQSRARNFGAKKAKAKYILFLDADVIVLNNTISRVVKFFKKNENAIAIIGRYHKKSANKGFVAEFKALRDYAYWAFNDKQKYSEIFAARIGAIDKKIFLKLKGFNPKYRHMEEYEFTNRLLQKYKIHYDPKIIVKHHFSNLWVMIKNHFWRSFYWLELFIKNKRFYSVATNPAGAIDALLAVIIIILLLLSFFNYYFFISLVLILAIYIFLNKNFLSLCYKTKGFVFTLGSLFVFIILNLFVFMGAFSYIIFLALKIFKIPTFK